jgi:hypothetical protein
VDFEKDNREDSDDEQRMEPLQLLGRSQATSSAMSCGLSKGEAVSNTTAICCPASSNPRLRRPSQPVMLTWLVWETDFEKAQK